jgi:hypothetical protein
MINALRAIFNDGLFAQEHEHMQKKYSFKVSQKLTQLHMSTHEN